MIYLDHAATTPLDPRVLEAMLPYLKHEFGNASSVHRLGRTARFAVEDARQRVAALLGAEEGEIVFTSGATEANNTALKGVLNVGDHFITSAAEHEAILEPAKSLAKGGVQTTLLPPAFYGAVTVQQIEQAIQANTRMVSVMHTNNEVGTISPVSNIGALCQSKGIVFHCDAVQGMGLNRLNVEELGVDLLSISGHKFYAPKGIGVLYIRNGTPMRTFVEGGAQERRQRGGTENVAAIVGLLTAMELAYQEAEARKAHIETLKRHLHRALVQTLGDIFILNTPLDIGESAAHILNISFPPLNGEPLDGEMLLLNMDMEGVCISSGSACTSGAVEPSHVLRAMNIPEATADATIRFSLGKDNTLEDIDQAVEALQKVLKRMRGHESKMA